MIDLLSRGGPDTTTVISTRLTQGSVLGLSIDWDLSVSGLPGIFRCIFFEHRNVTSGAVTDQCAILPSN